MRRLIAACGLALWVAAPPAGAQTNIANARLQERPAGNLAETIRQLASEPGPFWIAYSVPAPSAEWKSCCHRGWSDGCCGRCSLEDSKTAARGSGTRGPVMLEPGEPASVVFYRIEQRRIDKVRVFSDSCEIDAGGRTVHWLTGVSPAASVAFLETLVRTPAARDRTRAFGGNAGQVLLAIGAHAAPEAVRSLIGLARADASTKVRSEALFWLAHRAGRQAAATITQAIADDPEVKVKERAVFALSQLPSDEGVPRLIEVARTHANGRVRQQAMFWLGQSKDPRALSFFEEVLLR